MEHKPVATLDLTIAVVINSPAGLHARPAAQISAMADNALGPVWLEAKGEVADAGNIMELLALACLNGTHIVLRVENPQDKPVLAKIAAYIESGFEGVV